MSMQVERLTISVPHDLVALTDKIAQEKRISRSRVVSECLEELAQKRMIEMMEEGYKAMAKEHKEFARISAKAAAEAVPPWD